MKTIYSHSLPICCSGCQAKQDKFSVFPLLAAGGGEIDDIRNVKRDFKFNSSQFWTHADSGRLEKEKILSLFEGEKRMINSHWKWLLRTKMSRSRCRSSVVAWS